VDRHRLLIRRKTSDPTEPAYYIAYAPDHYPCPLTDPVKAAGARRAIEDDYQDAKQAAGLDETQARGYRAWTRHTALAPAAYALLAAASAPAKAAHPRPVPPNDPDQQTPADRGTTALTVPEIQRPPTTTTAQRIPANQDTGLHPACSDRRRRHQARARRHHYRTPLAPTARPHVSTHEIRLPY